MNKTIKYSDSESRYGVMIHDSDDYNIRIYPMGMNNICWNQDNENDENESSNCGLCVYSLSEDNIDGIISDIHDNSNTNDPNNTNISKIKQPTIKIDYLKYKLPKTKHKCKLPDSEILECFVSDNSNIDILYYIIMISAILWFIIF
jgi:hypothetical protein